MTMRAIRIVTLALASLGVVAAHSGAEMPLPDNPRWTPIADDVYLQPTSRTIATGAPLLAAAHYRGSLYVGDARGVARLHEDTLIPIEGLAGPVRRLVVIDDALYAAANGLWRYDGSAWTRIGQDPIQDVCAYMGGLYAASGTAVLKVEDDRLVPHAEGRQEPVLGIAAYGGALYVRHADRIGVVADGAFDYENVVDWGQMPMGSTIRDFLGDGSRLVVALDEGLSVLRGMTWYGITGEDGLCYEDTTCLAPGFAGDLWIGTTRGAIRHVDGEYQYYNYARWLPHDTVNAIAVSEDTAYLATDGGLGIIAFEPYTLRKKAAHYERWLDEWGMKRLGFIHKLSMRDGKWLRVVSDNDVGFSAHYFAAKCYEYAVTKDPAARAVAVDMMKTVKWSEEITSIPGFPARAIWTVGEEAVKSMTGSGGLPAEWHRDESGLFEWKGDTSSDETDAHIYVTSLFLDLVAEGAERDMAIEHISRVFGHIVDNGWVLRDVDGQPTRWARWDPEYLQRPYGFYARGLNGMEALSYVTTAYHFTQDEKFKQGKQQLIEWGYPREVLRQKLTFHPGYYTDFDDRLAFLVYHPLLRYEADPALRALWLRSLERSWEVKRIEGVPWYNYIYAAITGNDCENDRAVKHLREWPLDMVVWSQFNSHRDDLYTPDGYRSYAERIRPFSPREVGPKRVNRDWTVPDIDGQAQSVEDPSTWLEQYWMGRYIGLIEAPTVTDEALLTVPHRGLQLGAEPYDGPPRPELPAKP